MRSVSNLPAFLIIGAAKAGTTTLYDTLRQHPQVFLPAVKEPAFFCDDEYYANGVEWYRREFYSGAAPGAARGEATSTYLYWGDKVVPRLGDVYGDDLPRIIAIFRDPVSLVRSFYWHSVREGREPLDIRAALAAEASRQIEHAAFLRTRGRIVYGYRRIAAYASQLQPFLSRVPRSRCLFLLTEDLRDFDRLVPTLETFLELDHTPGLKPVASNTAALPRSPRLHRWLRQRSRLKDVAKPFLPAPLRHALKTKAIDANLRSFEMPPLDADVADMLRRHYADETRRLEDIIHRDLSSWYATS